MISQEPEAVALAYQWGSHFHPPDLGMQRQDPDFCPQGPSQTDLEKYYHQGQSSCDREPPPPLERFAKGTDTACMEGSCGVQVMSEQEQIMFSQASSWTGWAALGKPKVLAVRSVASPSSSSTSTTSATSAMAMTIAQLLHWLGAPTAAAMHAKGEGYGAWSIEDWYAHIREEETRVFPLLLRVADTLPSADQADALRNAVMKLVAEHTAVRNDFLVKGIPPPVEVAVPHGQMEDRILAMHGDQIRALGAEYLPKVSIPGMAETGRAYARPTQPVYGLSAYTRNARVGDVKYEIVYKAPMAPIGAYETSEAMSPEAFKTKFGMATVPEPPDPTFEKFLDPRHIGSGFPGRDMAGPCSGHVILSTGDSSPDGAATRYLYFTPGDTGSVPSVRNNARVRLALMRKKVEASVASSTRSRSVDVIRLSSHDALQQIAKDLYTNYQAVNSGTMGHDQLEEFSKRLGISIPDLLTSAPDIVKQLGTAKIKELAGEVWSAIGPQIMRELRVIAEEIGIISRGAGELGDASKAVPVIAAVITWYLDGMTRWSEAEASDWAKFCNDFLRTMIQEPFDRTAKLGLPFPWHAFDFDLKCMTPGGAFALHKSKWDATASQKAASDALKANLRRLEYIEEIWALAAITRWWALAVQLMSTGDMAAIFTALGNDAEGGLFASDEQVLLVAAPIAISYGFDIYDFAEALWNRSDGYRAAPGLLKSEPIKQWHYTDDGDIQSDPSTCAEIPANAMQAQWAVLARDAFYLAEDAIAGRVPGLKLPTTGTFFMDTPETRAAETVRADEIARRFFERKAEEAHQKNQKTAGVAIGGATAAVMAFTGFGLWSLAPLAIGLYLGFRKTKEDKRDNPEDRPAPDSAFTLAG